ncbi:tetratricopeptide repeat protein [Myxococcus sp. CA039A]|uniref:tetratricopeptide repeat protein n=2 Tax=unclassified Myxococcus TaxID=2648731 RepID=UPI00157B2F4D|nr:hypothetical protein [Myxococcus sp. CA039A]
MHEAALGCQFMPFSLSSRWLPRSLRALLTSLILGGAAGVAAAPPERGTGSPTSTQTSDELATALMKKVVSPTDNEDAALGLIALFPKLSSERQAEIASLGTSTQAALQVAHMGVANSWLTGVVCRGQPINALRRRRLIKEDLRIYDLECPPGKPHQVRFRFTEAKPEAPSTVPLTTSAVEMVLPRLQRKFGIETLEELRTAVEEPMAPNLSSGWLLGHLMDGPAGVRVYEAILKHDPDNLDAIVGLVTIQLGFGDAQGALKTLDAASLATVTLTDVRGDVTNKSALLTNRCAALHMLGKQEDALAACKQSVAMGSRKAGPYYLAMLLYLQGDDVQALAHVRTSIANDSRIPQGHFLEGLILQSLGRPGEAIQSWGRVPQFGPVATSSLEQARSRAAWIKLMKDFEREQGAASLALCGHYFLDLKMPERAESCFSRSRAVNPIHATVERLDHEVESAPARAFEKLQTELRKQRHPGLLRVMAAYHARAGRSQEALRWLDESLRANPSQERGLTLLSQICASLEDKDCLKHYREGQAPR